MYKFIVCSNQYVYAQVIFLTDPIDEYLTQNLTEYEDKKFQNASKDDLKIGSKDEKAKLKEIKESFKVLTKWWKDLVGGEHVESVKVYSMDYKLDTIVFDDSACLNTSLFSSFETPSRCPSFWIGFYSWNKRTRGWRLWTLSDGKMTEQYLIVGLLVYGLGEQPFGKHTRCGGDI